MSASANQRQVAIVTGASSGIGLGITRELLGHGYSVAAKGVADFEKTTGNCISDRFRQEIFGGWLWKRNLVQADQKSERRLLRQST